jgi:hypothetical protein
VVAALAGLTGLPGQVRRLSGSADEEGAVAAQTADAGAAGQRTFTGRDRE